MTNNSPFDNHIKREFEHYSPDVPDHIWQNIMAKKDKRKPVGFWLSFFSNPRTLLVIAAIMVTGGVFLFQNTTNTADESAKNIPATNSSTATAIDKNNDAVPGQQNPPININSNTATLPPDAANAVNNDAAPTEKNNSATHNTGAADISGPKENKQVKILAGRVTTGKDLTSDQIATGRINSTKTNIADFTTRGNNDDRKDLNRKSRINTASSLSMTTVAGETGTDDVVTEPANTNSFGFLSRRLLDMNISGHNKTFNWPSLKKPNTPDLNIPCPEAEKNSAGNKKYIEIYGGPDYAFRKLSDTANSTYLKKRKESTSFSSAFSVGLRYTRVFRNGVSIRTGVNYSQINEKFSFAQGNVIQTTYITDINGDTTGSYATNGTRYKTTYNKFRTIDIPLVFGYELGNGRIHTNINAGAIINLYSWQKGDVLDASYQPVNVTTGKSSSPYQFRTNVGIGFIGSVSVYYKLNDRMHILAEPYFRYSFSPASKAELTLKQKYNTAGLRIGLRVDF